MPKLDGIDIADVVKHFGLELSPRTPEGRSSFNVRCPFCSAGSKPSYKMNVDVVRGAYRCVKCGTAGGTLDLFARLRFGTTHTKGPNGNGKMLAEELKQELNLNEPGRFAGVQKKEPGCSEVDRVDDGTVANTYEKLLSLPCFELTDQHRGNLLKRGLSPEAVEANGYRSFTIEGAECLITEKVKTVFKKERLSSARYDPAYSKLSRYSDKQLMIGLAIANIMLRSNCRMDGVPGFFKLKKRWCFLFDSGLAIPTRNVYGKIVAMQLRLDTGNLRYKTLSSKDLPRGVTRNISRVHFCRANNTIGPDTTVLFTEGPLKADVALDILQKHYHRYDVAIFALQGVSNTGELPGIFTQLRDLGGTKTVVNALDMDKLTNINVTRASQRIRNLAHDAGLCVAPLLWDRKYASEKAEEWTALCRERGITGLPADANVYVRLGKMTHILDECEVELPAEQRDWAKSSKGIDDMLLSSLRQP